MEDLQQWDIRQARLALDFGGTKLAAAVVDVEQGILRSYKKIATPPSKSANDTIRNMIDLANQVLDIARLDRFEVKIVGISFGGLVSADRSRVAESGPGCGPGWIDYPLLDVFANEFQAEVYLENDGNAAALGEWYFGAGNKATNMFYVTVSTGIGAGLILNGCLYRGMDAAGEFGHVVVEPEGRICYCGNRGCLESYSSGLAIAKQAQERFNQLQPKSLLRELSTGQAGIVDAKMVFEAARHGDTLCQEIIYESSYYLGLGLANAISLLDPDVVVIGGGISLAQDLLKPMLETVVIKNLIPIFQSRLRIVFAKLLGKEALYGAALLDSLG